MGINRRGILIFGVLVILLFCFFAFMYWRALLSPLHINEKSIEVSVQIPENSSCNQISEIIYQSGLVRGPRLVSSYARLKGLDQDLKPGRYVFNTNQSIPEMVALLYAGADEMVYFTIPEGFNLDQISDLLIERGLAEKEVLKTALESSQSDRYEFIQDIPSGQSLEGYLFPDTYHVGPNTTEGEIIKMMLDRFQLELNSLDYLDLVKKADLTLHQALTIASLVEGEAAVDEERPLISGVIHNRLRIGMPLQIDATVIYALGEHKSKVYYKDLEVESPYNTYKVLGLPPGPINSPGRSSLMAAVQPADTSYLYYVAKKDGSHAFADTLEEHNNNIAKYQ